MMFLRNVARGHLPADSEDEDDGMPPELPRLGSRAAILKIETTGNLAAANDGAPEEACSVADSAPIAMPLSPSDEEDSMPPPGLDPLSSYQEAETAWAALDSAADGHLGEADDTNDDSDDATDSAFGEEDAAVAAADLAGLVTIATGGTDGNDNGGNGNGGGDGGGEAVPPPAGSDPASRRGDGAKDAGSGGSAEAAARPSAAYIPSIDDPLIAIAEPVTPRFPSRAVSAASAAGAPVDEGGSGSRAVGAGAAQAAPAPSSPRAGLFSGFSIGRRRSGGWALRVGEADDPAAWEFRLSGSGDSGGGSSESIAGGGGGDSAGGGGGIAAPTVAVTIIDGKAAAADEKSRDMSSQGQQPFEEVKWSPSQAATVSPGTAAGGDFGPDEPTAATAAAAETAGELPETGTEIAPFVAFPPSPPPSPPLPEALPLDLWPERRRGAQERPMESGAGAAAEAGRVAMVDSMVRKATEDAVRIAAQAAAGGGAHGVGASSWEDAALVGAVPAAAGASSEAQTSEAAGATEATAAGSSTASLEAAPAPTAISKDGKMPIAAAASSAAAVAVAAAAAAEAAVAETNVPRDNLALHRAVFLGDEDMVRKVLRYRLDLLDVRDHRGNTPLLLAIKRGHFGAAHILVENGAGVEATSGGGFSLLDEAILAADERLLVRVYTILQRQHWARWRAKVVTLLEAMQRMPDFHLTMEWAFECNNLLAPLVKAMAPSDTYRVWKHGSWIRVDCTITGFGKRFRAERGSISLLLTGTESPVPGTLLKLDHDKHKVYSVLRRLDNPSPTELRRACRRFLAAERKSKAVEALDWSASDLAFAPTMDRRGRQKSGKVEEWDCLRYEVTGDVKFQSFRKQGGEHAELKSISLDAYLEGAPAAASAVAAASTAAASAAVVASAAGSDGTALGAAVAGGKSVGEDASDGGGGGEAGGGGSGGGAATGGAAAGGGGEGGSRPVSLSKGSAAAAAAAAAEQRQPHKKIERRLKTDMWMSREFPLGVEHLSPVLEVLAMQDSIVGKLRDVLNTKGVQQAGFPVRVSLPLYLGVSWVVVFKHCRREPQFSELFDLPPNYSFSKRMRQVDLWRAYQVQRAAAEAAAEQGGGGAAAAVTMATAVAAAAAAARDGETGNNTSSDEEDE